MAKGYGCQISGAERTWHENLYKKNVVGKENLQKSVNQESLKGNALLHAVPLAFRSGIYDAGRWNLKRETTAFDATFAFMDDLAKNSEVIDDPQGVYIHIHDESTHFPYYSPMNGALAVCGVDRCFKWSLSQVADWFAWLKENNVYDNTRIILCSDHGIGNDKELSFDARYAKNVELMKKASDCVCSYFALLAVKDFASHGEVKVDMSTKTVSHGAYFAFDNPRFSQPVKEIVSSYVTNLRPPTWKERLGFDIQRSFRIIGDASDGANWSRVTK